MKGVTLALLAVIAAAAGYLAWATHQQRSASAAIAARLADPGGYAAKQWAEMAGLQCDLVWDVETAAVNGTIRPIKFLCAPRVGAIVRIEEIYCPSSAWDAPSGIRTSEGLYKPLSAICWKANAP